MYTGDIVDAALKLYVIFGNVSLVIRKNYYNCHSWKSIAILQISFSASAVYCILACRNFL